MIRDCILTKIQYCFQAIQSATLTNTTIIHSSVPIGILYSQIACHQGVFD